MTVAELKTLVLDFDETLAKVAFKREKLPNYDEQVDLLLKNKTVNVSALVGNTLADLREVAPLPPRGAD